MELPPEKSHLLFPNNRPPSLFENSVGGSTPPPHSQQKGEGDAHYEIAEMT